jgi:hypothetical protein
MLNYCIATNIFRCHDHIHCKMLICIAMKTKSLHNKLFYCHKKLHIAMEEDFVVKTNPVSPINFMSWPMSRLISEGHEAQ